METLGVMDPYLRDLTNKIPVFMVFARCLRDGRLSRSRNPVRAAHVRDKMAAVAKTFTRVGFPDLRLTNAGSMDPRLSNLYC